MEIDTRKHTMMIKIIQGKKFETANELSGSIIKN